MLYIQDVAIYIKIDKNYEVFRFLFLWMNLIVLNYYKTNGADVQKKKIASDCINLDITLVLIIIRSNETEFLLFTFQAIISAAGDSLCRFYILSTFSLFLLKYSKGHWLILWIRFRVQFYSIWLKTNKAFKKQGIGVVNWVETNFWLLNSAQMNVIQNIF